MLIGRQNFKIHSKLPKFFSAVVSLYMVLVTHKITHEKVTLKVVCDAVLFLQTLQLKDSLQQSFPFSSWKQHSFLSPAKGWYNSMDYSHIHTHTFNLFSSLRCKAYSKNGRAYTHKVYTVFLEQPLWLPCWHWWHFALRRIFSLNDKLYNRQVCIATIVEDI